MKAPREVLAATASSRGTAGAVLGATLTTRVSHRAMVAPATLILAASLYAFGAETQPTQ